MTGHVTTTRRRRLVLLLAISALLPGVPVVPAAAQSPAAQSPASPVVTPGPVATPAGPLIDPRSAAGRPWRATAAPFRA